MPSRARTPEQQPPGHPRTSYKESRDAEVKMFSRRLWRLMVGKGWNQSELARQSGVGRDMISGYVRAKHLPDPPHAQKLAAALGAEIEDLFPISSGGADAAPAIVQRELPPVEMRATTDGKVMLQLNLEVPMEVALQVLTLIQKPAGE